MSKTIVLHNVEPITLCIKRQKNGEGYDLVLEARFQYTDGSGNRIEAAARDSIREVLPSAEKEATLQFLNSTVIPFIRGQRGLDE